MKFPSLTLLFFPLSIAFSWAPPARADLGVVPMRVILSEADKSAQIAVRNKGAKTVDCRIDSVFNQMQSDGTMLRMRQPVNDPLSGVGQFVFSPRHLVIPPNTEQVVRLMINPDASSADQELYAHLEIEAVAEEDPKIQATNPSDESEIVTVPILIKRGRPELKVVLSELQIHRAPDGKLAYSANLALEGKAFFHGDLFAYFSEPGAKAPMLLGQETDISSFVAKRELHFPLNAKSLPKGELRVEARAPVTEGGVVLSAVKLETENISATAPLVARPAPTPTPASTPGKSPENAEEKPAENSAQASIESRMKAKSSPPNLESDNKWHLQAARTK